MSRLHFSQVPKLWDFKGIPVHCDDSRSWLVTGSKNRLSIGQSWFCLAEKYHLLGYPGISLIPRTFASSTACTWLGDFGRRIWSQWNHGGCVASCLEIIKSYSSSGRVDLKPSIQWMWELPPVCSRIWVWFVKVWYETSLTSIQDNQITINDSMIIQSLGTINHHELTLATNRYQPTNGNHCWHHCHRHWLWSTKINQHHPSLANISQHQPLLNRSMLSHIAQSLLLCMTFAIQH